MPGSHAKNIYFKSPCGEDPVWTSDKEQLIKKETGITAMIETKNIAPIDFD
jgi:hypothetical protein